jgi:hypothetical protein
MSLSQARTFLKQQIALADSSISEHRDPFNNENIPQTNIDDKYHILFGTVTTTQDDNWIQDGWSATVTLFKRGYSDPQTALDTLLDTANCIRLKVIDPEAVLTDNIHSVEAVSLTPEPVDITNDNTLKVSIEFNIKLIFYTK